MPQIEVITTALTDTAKRIGEIIDTIQGCQRYISGTALNGLEDYFSGTLPNVMVNFSLAKQSAYDKMLSALEGYKQAIESSAATYEASEEQLTKWADHLGEKGVQVPLPRPADGWDVSGGWDTVEPSFPNGRPDLNSKYYEDVRDKDNKNKQLNNVGKYWANGHIDCCFYARSRAMEVNGWDQLPSRDFLHSNQNGEEALKNGNCLVWFRKDNDNDHTHVVYVEHYDSETNTVYFSDANMDHADGLLQALPYDEFLHLNNNMHFSSTEVFNI